MVVIFWIEIAEDVMRQTIFVFERTFVEVAHVMLQVSKLDCNHASSKWSTIMNAHDEVKVGLSLFLGECIHNLCGHNRETFFNEILFCNTTIFNDIMKIPLGGLAVHLQKMKERPDEIVKMIKAVLKGTEYIRTRKADILARRPKVRVVIVGGDEVSYGSPPPGARGFKQLFLDEVRDRIDLSRVHFVSRVPYDTLVQLLRISSAHVYLTVPFVLSWSMLEAMSLQALVIGSDTAPVREVIDHGRNGLLVDFFSPAQLADTVCDVLADPERFAPLREAARRTVVERYDFRTRALPAYMDLIEGR